MGRLEDCPLKSPNLQYLISIYNIFGDNLDSYFKFINFKIAMVLSSALGISDGT